MGRSPWTAADARVRLLAGRPGGRPRARAPDPIIAPQNAGYPSQADTPLMEMLLPVKERLRPQNLNLRLMVILRIPAADDARP